MPKNHPLVLDVSAYLGEWVTVDPATYKVLGHGDSPEQATRNVLRLALLLKIDCHTLIPRAPFNCKTSPG